MTERRRATSSATLPDLTTCDQEPIHIPSLIQPHGVLLAMDEPDLIIRQVSTNSKIVIGVAPEALLGQPLSAVLAAEEIDQIRTALAHEHLEANPLYLFTVKVRGKRRALDGIAHRYQIGRAHV